MCTLKIYNIGALKNVELSLNKLTVLLGPQSSGKSTLTRVLCHCQWIEKRCYVNFEEESKRLMQGTNFIDGIKEYYRMDGYFREDSQIHYEGNYIILDYRDEQLSISKVLQTNSYLYPKLCYIPAERNLVTAIPNLKKYNETNDLILYFMYDWFTAREYLKKLDITQLVDRSIKYEYNKDSDTDRIFDGSSSPLKLSNASSGVQSLLPLYGVVSYVVDSIYKRFKPLSSEEKIQLEQAVVSVKEINERLTALQESIAAKSEAPEIISEKLEVLKDSDLVKYVMNHKIEIESLLDSSNRTFFYQRSDLYVEEPEQNLFPDAQFNIVYWLISQLNNNERDHSLFITTHSPYILFALNNCMLGSLVSSSISEKEKPSFHSRHSWIDPQKVNVYEIHEGKLRSIQDKSGLLINNYLNNAYRQVNSEYLNLLDFYEN